MESPSEANSSLILKIITIKVFPSTTRIRVSMSSENKGTYKLFGRALDHNLCDYIKKDKLFYPTFLHYGKMPTVCPITPDTYYMDHLKDPLQNFPVSLGKGKWKAEFNIYNNNVDKSILKIIVFAHILV